MEKFSNNPIHVSLAHSYMGKLDGTDEFTCVSLCYRAFLLSLRSMCLTVSGLKSRLSALSSFFSSVNVSTRTFRDVINAL